MMYEEGRALIQLLAGLGLDIWPHRDPSYGWYYSWYGRESGDGNGPFTTPLEAARAAFLDARKAINFRREYSSFRHAEKGQTVRYDGDKPGDPDGWIWIKGV